MKVQKISSFAELAEHVKALNLPPVTVVTGRAVSGTPNAKEQPPASRMSNNLRALVQDINTSGVVRVQQLKSRGGSPAGELRFNPDTMTIRGAHE